MPELLHAEPDTATRDGAPDYTTAFAHHGVELSERGSQATGDCPFCGKHDKLSVEVATGLWRCFVCGRSGNPLEFLRQLHETSAAGTEAGWAAKLAVERGLMHADTVVAWGACRSAADGGWLLPGYSTCGDLTQLYCRRQVKNERDGSWRWVLLPTPGVWESGRSHALHMPRADFDPDRKQLYVCEGPWDGMALWEVMGRARWGGERPSVTGVASESLLAGANVLAVPGCTTWRGEWTEMCRGRDVVLLYDNDHPKTNGGTTSTPGADGMRRVAGKLAGAAASVSWLRWGEAGYDSAIASGFDVRDWLTKGV